MDDPLVYLSRRRFPDCTGPPIPLSLSGTPPRVSAERWAEFEKWRREMLALPQDELEKLADAEREKEADQHRRMNEARERARFFHHSEAAADFEYWSKMAHWSIDEAVALSLGKSPHVVTLSSMRPFAVRDQHGTPPSPLAVSYLERMEIAKRAVQWRQIFDPVLPGLFLGWTQRMDLAVPGALIKAVEARGAWVGDWQSLFERQKAVTREWELKARAAEERSTELGQRLAQVEQTRDELKARADSPVRSSAVTRERETLLKLVIGMAIRGYGHDPAAPRSKAVSEIASDLEGLGISLNDDTIRKWLKDAAASVLPGGPPEC